MSRKLKGNGLWESSRMMLPEHKEAILRHRNQPCWRPPQLDEQQQEKIQRILAQSYREKWAVTITYSDGRQPQQITGIITKIEAERQRLHIQGNGESLWLDFHAILDADSGRLLF